MRKNNQKEETQLTEINCVSPKKLIINHSIQKENAMKGKAI